ncbi:receptor expression-enhancing protein [Striga asiatica]|uniref:HVA22-like protein n=1 Tax=Striga asiatica TaxID=4170 RepID=A0A5A7P865_STRAF|nr:receptor expression-enhancing protein [Striga asiatica]
MVSQPLVAGPKPLQLKAIKGVGQVINQPVIPSLLPRSVPHNWCLDTHILHFNVSKPLRKTESKFQNSVFGVNIGEHCLEQEIDLHFHKERKKRTNLQLVKSSCVFCRIIVAVITILEKIGDVFVSWLPIYGEMKLALFIYLWYPKTKGTGVIYDTLLRPYVSKHETNIDRSLIEFRERAWNLAIYYWHNCTELGSTKILQFLQFVSSQSGRVTEPSPEIILNQEYEVEQSSSPPRKSFGFFRRSKPEKRAYRNQTSKSEAIKVELQNQRHFIRPEDVLVSDPLGADKSDVDHEIEAARNRLRRFIDG